MRRLLYALCALSCVSLAHAQDNSKPTTEPKTPAIATPGSTNPVAPVAGENSFTEGQAKRLFEDKGYLGITSLKKSSDGIWTASATKDGRPFEVKLDYQGNIIETPK